MGIPYGVVALMRLAYDHIQQLSVTLPRDLNSIFLESIPALIDAHMRLKITSAIGGF